ncbi:MAG TPA: FadD3 family acyl-CoA ligase [Acidimicrobiales bacterium]|nr:FadD3 family acyl-CoA ligase [Acidimicrobiales bacterium]
MNPGFRVSRGDEEWGSIPNLVRFAADRYADHEAIVDHGTTAVGAPAATPTRLTYRELGEAAEAAARAFAAAGLRPGDRVAIWAPNSAEWVVALLGLHLAGGVLVPLNTRFRGAEAAFVLRRSRARFLCTVEGFLGTDYVSLLDGHDLPDLERILVFGAEAGERSWQAFVSDPGVRDFPLPERRPEDLSDIIFTSGTTGEPKGVTATHSQSLRAFAEWARIVGLAEGDRYLLVNPMFHTFGYKAGVLASLMAGVTIVPVPLFDVELVCARIVQERITVLPGPPTLYQSLLARPEALAHPTLRLAVTGAAVIPVDLVRRMHSELGFETVLTAYGLTEATGFVTSCRQGDDPETIATTSGRAIDGVEVEIVDDEGREVPRGESGEIRCRGYNVTSGYFEDPEQTAATIDSDGWLRTGDVGVMDDAGNIRITDRKKDMFIVGGFNAYPAEIENLLRANPAVGNVAVVGVPDDRLGEVGVAFVVWAPGSGEAAGEELIAWARDNMANYKVPRQVFSLEALPLNASGKVLKYELRARALELMPA